MGQGPMTGRAAGYCAGASMAGYMNPAPGRGFGNRRCGFWGRGWRNRFSATGWGFGPFAIHGDPSSPSTVKEQEMELLREQARHLDETLDDIKKRLEELGVKENKG